MQGFLPASCLRPFDPSCLSPVATQPRRLSNASASSNSPQPRPPSIASVSSNEMSAYVMEGADVTRGLSRRQSASPYTLRQGLSPTGQGQPSPVDVDNAFDDEEEMLSDVEYGEVGGVKKKKEFFLVEFDFISRSALELSVKPGDILTLIVPHDVEGNVEWWLMANVEGKQGYVPANYMTKAEYLWRALSTVPVWCLLHCLRSSALRGGSFETETQCTLATSDCAWNVRFCRSISTLLSPRTTCLWRHNVNPFGMFDEMCQS